MCTRDMASVYPEGVLLKLRFRQFEAVMLGGNSPRGHVVSTRKGCISRACAYSEHVQLQMSFCMYKRPVLW